MGSSPSGFLLYGYVLGGPEMGWRLPDGELNVPWMTEENLDDGIAEAAAVVLRASVGFEPVVEVAEGTPDYYRRMHEADRKVGVSIEATGSHEFPSYVLAIRPTGMPSVEWSETLPLDLDLLSSLPYLGDWDGILSRALGVLGLEPLVGVPGSNPLRTEWPRATPQWHLCTYYG